MKKKPFFIFLAIIIVLIILGIIVNFVYLKVKISTLRDISQKQKEFSAKDNYNNKITMKTAENVTEIDYYRKGEQSIIFINIKDNSTQSTAKAITLEENGKSKTYCENGKEEIFKEHGMVLGANPVSFDFENKSDKEIIQSLKFSNISIKPTTYNNKDCYLYESHIADNVEKYYLDKGTGLVIQYEVAGTEWEYDHKFDCVEDSIFTEVDLSEYTLLE